MSTYQPLSEVRKSLKVKWYRTKIDREKLKELSERSDVQGWTSGPVSADRGIGILLLVSATVVVNLSC